MKKLTHWFLHCLLVSVFFVIPTSFTLAQNMVADKHLEMGKEYFYFSVIDSALHHWQIADSLYEELSLWPRQMECKVGLIKVAIHQQNIPKAAEIVKSGIAYGVPKIGKDDKNIGLLYSFDGLTTFLLKRDMDAAFEQIDTALAIIERTHATDTVGWICYFHRALIYYYSGQVKAGIAAAQQSIAKISTHTIKEASHRSRINNLLGAIYRQQGDYWKSVDYYQKAIQGIDRLENSQKKYKLEKAKSGTYHNLGNTYYEIGQYEKSMEYLKKALAINKKRYAPDHLSLGASHLSLANVLSFLGKYDQALKHFNIAEKIIAKYPGREYYYSGVFHNRGTCYLYLKQFDLAHTNFQKALDIRQNTPGLNANHIAETLEEISQVYKAEKKWKKAEEYTKRAIVIHRKELGEKNAELAHAQFTLAEIYFEAKNYEKALETCRQSLLNNFPDLPPSFSIEDIPNSKVSFSDYAHSGVISIKASIFYQLYLQSKDIKYLELSNKHYLESDQLITFSRQEQSRLEDQIRLNEAALKIYQRAVEVSHMLYQHKKDDAYLEQAFYFSERSKTQALQVSLSKSDVFSFPGVPETLLKKEKRLRDSIAIITEKLSFLGEQDSLLSRESLEEKLFARNQDYDLLIDSFKVHYPSYYEVMHSDNRITLKVIQEQLLDQDQQIIEYFLSESKIHIFLISSTDASWHTVNIPPDLEISIEAYLSAMRDNHILQFSGQSITTAQKTKADRIYANTGHQLYQLLLGSLSNKDLSSKLIIIPDGLLGNLPFETLLSEQPKVVGTYHNYPFLIHQHQISYTYSTSLLHQIRKRKTSTAVHQQFLAFAPEFPDCPSERVADNAQSLRSNYFGPIQNEAEVLSIQQIVGGKVMLANEATLANFISQSPQYAFLHIASHAKANDQNPALSLVGLSAEQSKDCVFDTLSATRIANLSLPAEMVVLSACEGAAGQLQKGEGIRSLAMAFTYAGAKSLCTTLWSVQDKAMSTIMTDYYQHLDDGSPKDEALQKAKLKYLAEHDNELSHPFYWAAPILIGEAKAVSFSGSGGGLPLWAYVCIGLVVFLFVNRSFRNR